jgi:hypothetical protein
MPGWRRSADRACLHVNSLLTGNFTGNFAILRLREPISWLETTALQGLIAQFPKQINRENFSKNREEISRIRQLFSKVVSVHFSHTCSVRLRTRSLLTYSFAGGGRDVVSSRTLWCPIGQLLRFAMQGSLRNRQQHPAPRRQTFPLPLFAPRHRRGSPSQRSAQIVRPGGFGMCNWPCFRVAEYRAYTVGSDGHFVGFEPLICADDAEATEQAKRLVDGCDVELWSGERSIVRLYRENGPRADG